MKEKTKSTLIVLLMLFVILFVMLTLSGHAFAKEAGGIVWTKITNDCGIITRTEISRTEVEEEYIPSMTVNIYDMYHEFKQVPLAANQRYSGKMVSFAGFVKDIIVIEEQTIVIINVGVQNDDTEIHCVFNNPDSRIIRDSILVIRGMCLTNMNSPQIVNCSVIL